MPHSSLRLPQVSIVESSGYLESWLWPNYSASASHKHTMSLFWMINEKFLEGTAAWRTITATSEHFGHLFDQALTYLLESEANNLSRRERVTVLIFLIRCIQSLVSCYMLADGSATALSVGTGTNTLGIGGGHGSNGHAAPHWAGYMAVFAARQARSYVCAATKAKKGVESHSQEAS
jgi:hypothetical protein